MSKNPFALFARWYALAARHRAIEDHTAMSLSTVDPSGYPDGRMVLLKEFSEDGFVFFTNLNSIKGKSLARTPRAALTFYWGPLYKQVRIQGRTERVSDAEADAYWNSRPRLSQLGGWASRQSETLANRALLVKEVARLAAKFKGERVPRPPHWTGIRVIPHKIEFWEGRANRLHDRLLYERSPRGWTLSRLYP